MNWKEHWIYFVMDILLFVLVTLFGIDRIGKRKKFGRPLLKIDSAFHPSSLIIVLLLYIVYVDIQILKNSWSAWQRFPELGYYTVVSTIISIVLLIYATILLVFVYLRKSTIYENGIIKPPLFLFFSGIDDFSWEDGHVLHIKEKPRRFGFSTKVAVRWDIPAEFHDEVDAILKRKIVIKNPPSSINSLDS